MSEDSLNTTNLLLGIMALASVIQVLVLIGVGVMAFRLYRQTLVVEAASPEWRRQLSSMSWEIVAKLNAAAGKEVVTDVQFQVARRPPARAATAMGLTRDEADAIADPHLRRLYRQSRQRRKEK